MQRKCALNQGRSVGPAFTIRNPTTNLGCRILDENAPDLSGPYVRQQKTKSQIDVDPPTWTKESREARGVEVSMGVIPTQLTVTISIGRLTYVDR